MSDYVTLAQAAALTGLHPDTLRKQCLANPPKREGYQDENGKWYVRNPQKQNSETTQNMPQNGTELTCERGLGVSGTQIGDAEVSEVFAGYDYLIETMQAEIARTRQELRRVQEALEKVCRNVSGLNAAVNDQTQRNAGQETVNEELRGKVLTLENWRRTQATEGVTYRRPEVAGAVRESERGGRAGFLGIGRKVFG